MKVQMKLSITGSHQEIHSGEKEEIKITADASYLEKDGVHYIFYDEQQEGALIKNRVVIIPEVSVEIIKRGAISSDMLLYLNKKLETEYRTPFVTMDMSFDTKYLEFEVSEEKLYLKVEYIMGIEGQDHAKCSVLIKTLD